MKSVNWEMLTPAERNQTLQRPVQTTNSELSQKVRQIIEKVKYEKDRAIFYLTQEFDHVDLTSLQVTPFEIQQAYQKIDPSTLDALKKAIRRITLFHEAQFPKPLNLETSPGVRCERRFVPIERVGLYVPGGTAPLPSTVMMLGIPAKIAGCETRILATPPNKKGTVEPSILVAADLLGIQNIFKVGGAQAIAAMAFGTETIPKVDKIFGPGNSWVTEAKIQVAKDAQGAIYDLPAGPSEVMVIADSSANPAFVAADLLSQAEHGSDSQVVFVTHSKELIEKVQVELSVQLNKLPRKKLAEQALSKSVIIQVPTLESCLNLCNEYAPEHLILQMRNARDFSSKIRNAGSVFLGPWTPESVGDYASGTNHVLPTYGYARALSGLGTEHFMKSITFQELTYEGLLEIGSEVEELAKVESLEAHRNAVRIRLETGRNRVL